MQQRPPEQVPVRLVLGNVQAWSCRSATISLSIHLVSYSIFTASLEDRPLINIRCMRLGDNRGV